MLFTRSFQMIISQFLTIKLIKFQIIEYAKYFNAEKGKQFENQKKPGFTYLNNKIFQNKTFSSSSKKHVIT